MDNVKLEFITNNGNRSILLFNSHKWLSENKLGSRIKTEGNTSSMRGKQRNNRNKKTDVFSQASTSYFSATTYTLSKQFCNTISIGTYRSLDIHNTGLHSNECHLFTKQCYKEARLKSNIIWQDLYEFWFSLRNFPLFFSIPYFSGTYNRMYPIKIY